MVAKIAKETVDYAKFLMKRKQEHPDLLEQVELKTPWYIIDEICNGDYSHVNATIEASLARDVTKVTGAGFFMLDLGMNNK